MVDTGFTFSCFDTSIPLGRPVMTRSVDSPIGKAEVKFYRPPKQKLGTLHSVFFTPSWALTSILCASLAVVVFTECLEWTFLGTDVLYIDVEKGELLLLNSARQGRR